jgi:hypothetical protein
LQKVFSNCSRRRKSWSTAQKPWRVESFNSDMTEDKPTFFFFYFQSTGCEILNARHGALFLKSLRKLFKFQKKCNGLPGMLDLRRQRTTKATGNAWCLHLQTLSLALALAWRLQCEHLFFLRLMETNPRSSPFTADSQQEMMFAF